MTLIPFSNSADPGTTPTTSPKSSSHSLYKAALAAYTAVEVESTVAEEEEEVAATTSPTFPKQSPLSGKHQHPLQQQEEGSAGEGEARLASPRVLTGAPAYHQLESEVSPVHSRLRAQPPRQHADYEPVQRASPSDVYSLQSSGTEGSSFGSNCSANELLPQDQRSDSKADGEDEEEEEAS